MQLCLDNLSFWEKGSTHGRFERETGQTGSMLYHEVSTDPRINQVAGCIRRVGICSRLVGGEVHDYGTCAPHRVEVESPRIGQTWKSKMDT